MQLVTSDKRGDVAWLAVNRPERRNALSAAVIRELRGALAAIKADPAIRTVVLTGAGDRHFSAGGDLDEIRQTDTGGAATRDPLSGHRVRSELNLIFRDLQDLGKPTIARVCGLALAGGFGLALGCDFIVASADAEFGLPEARVGLWPYIVTESLIRSVSPRVALQLMLTGRRVSAEEGYRLGFVYAVAAAAEIDSVVDELASDLRASSPTAIALGRTSFYQALDAEPVTRMIMLEHALTLNLGLPDAEEGVAAFLERRRPRWNPESMA